VSEKQDITEGYYWARWKDTGVKLEEITDGYWWVLGKHGTLKVGEVWRRTAIDDPYEAARIRFMGDDFDYRLESCLHSGSWFAKIGQPMTTWTPSRTYAVGDRVPVPNPLTRWDRFIMWFGFKRWSPAETRRQCVGVWPPMPEGSIHE
jgi:hypothetical protein